MKHMAGVLNKLASVFAIFLLCGAAVKGQEGREPHQVTIGMYVNDIQSINLTTYSYAVDLYLWFRWKDPSFNPVKQFEYMNSFDPEAHVQTLLYDEPVPQPDGSLYQVVRHQGIFSTKFPLHDYPFDRQTLKIVVEDSQMETHKLVYVADKEPFLINPEIEMPGYTLGTARVELNAHPYPTAFGDLSSPGSLAYSRADFLIPISRPPMAGVFKAFIPVLLIILSAALALMLDPTHVEARIGLAITALLTLVALQFTMLSGLPEVTYLTLIDQVYLLSYLYILVVLGLAVRAGRIDQTGEIQSDLLFNKRWDKTLSVGATGCYLMLLIGIIWYNLKN